MTDTNDDLMRQVRLHNGHLARPALEIVRDLGNQLETGTRNGFSKLNLTPVQPAFLSDQTLCFGLCRRADRGHRAVLKDVFGKILGANISRSIFDALLVGHTQGPQQHSSKQRRRQQQTHQGLAHEPRFGENRAAMLI